MKLAFFSLLLVLIGCQTKAPKSEPQTKPEAFLPEFIPENQIAHAGVFSTDQKEYYYTLSDIEFSTFTVMRARKAYGHWTDPDTAFFNTEYNEHGVHFAPDGRTLYFSSTRPVGSDTIPDTWHIWYCKRVDGTWSIPEFINIPELNQKLVSHPASTRSGRLYFHVAHTDYSNLNLYFVDQKDGQYTPPKQVDLPGDFNRNCFTPFVSPDESYLMFAKIVEYKEELFISYRENGAWGECIRLADKINTNNLGNPYVTPDGAYLYYASGEKSAYGLPYNWVIRKIPTEAMLP